MAQDATREPVEDFREFGVLAFTTTRAAGSFNAATDEPVAAVMGRWNALRESLLPVATRFATSKQVHGSGVISHDGEWEGWLRAPDADGHFALARGTAMGVTIADCVPVFLAHPSGACALLHSGWRGTVARIAARGVREFERSGLSASDLRCHLGPAICGACYEVSADVYVQLTGETSDDPGRVDLRAVIARHVRALGVRHVSSSNWCTRCDGDRFFSHRAGDEGRQVAVMLAAR
ncbi:MAG: polyphenol oxidase family protein [Gemmatimonadaceae bacterium]